MRVGFGTSAFSFMRGGVESGDRPIKIIIAHGDHGQRLPSGVYFYRFKTVGYTATRKMVLMQ